MAFAETIDREIGRNRFPTPWSCFQGWLSGVRRDTAAVSLCKQHACNEKEIPLEGRSWAARCEWRCRAASRTGTRIGWV